MYIYNYIYIYIYKILSRLDQIRFGRKSQALSDIELCVVTYTSNHCRPIPEQLLGPCRGRKKRIQDSSHTEASGVNASPKVHTSPNGP